VLPPTLLLLQVDEVKNIMSENIEKVLSRGEKLDLLVDKTDNLMFEVRSRTDCCPIQLDSSCQAGSQVYVCGGLRRI
jgi:hypothetical protein